MRAIDKPHVSKAIIELLTCGAATVATTAKVVAMSFNESQFYIIGNDVDPTFAFHPELGADFARLGIEFESGRHSGVRNFPRAPGSQQHEYLSVHELRDAVRVLKEVLA
jgi:hypothetical protein